MFRIAKIEACAVSIPLESPLRMAGVDIASAENLIVRVSDRDGNRGWGEAASAPLMTGETAEGMVAAVRYMAPQLEETEVESPEALHRSIDRLVYGNNGAKAAIEIALLDLIGRRRKQPLHELLGGRVRDEAVMLTMVASGDPESEVRNAREQRDAGFAAFKIKVGNRAPEDDLERVAAVRAAAGKEARLSADANQGYDRDCALRFAEGAAQAGLDFMEQLVAADDLEGMAACARSSTVPLGADEGLHSFADIRRHRDAGAAQGGSLKTIKLGGAFAVMEAARLMQTLGMHVNLAGKVAESGIASAAVAHLSMAVPQLDWDTSITCRYLADDIVAEPLRIVDGRLRLGDEAGLGVTVDIDKLTRYRSVH